MQFRPDISVARQLALQFDNGLLRPVSFTLPYHTTMRLLFGWCWSPGRDKDGFDTIGVREPQPSCHTIGNLQGLDLFSTSMSKQSLIEDKVPVNGDCFSG
jgi:hypothetical protein